jgi:hypothetical protein
MLMDSDDYKQVWQTQSRLTIDTELLVNEVRRNQQQFTTMLFWRDVREVGICVLLVLLWFYVGAKLALPWTWYLIVPALLWVGGYMLADRFRHKRQPLDPAEPLQHRVKNSLAQIEQQIRLLRSVHWWCLLPMAPPLLAFQIHVTWQIHDRLAHWWMFLASHVAIVAIVFAGVYWLNQQAIRRSLEPRRQELQKLLQSLEDETGV